MCNPLKTMALGSALSVLFWSTAEADTYSVTRSDDPLPAMCAIGNCSLRGAVLAANAHVGRDNINLGNGEYHLTLHAPGGGPLKVTDSVAVHGIGNNQTVVRARNSVRIFDVQSAILILDSLVLLDGREQGTSFPANAGGCVYAFASTVTLIDTTIANCMATYGGALYLDGGQGLLTRSKVKLNKATYGGGVAIDGLDTRLSLSDRSFLTHNDASMGGGLYSRGGMIDGGTGAITHPVRVELGGDSWIDGNHAQSGGGVANEWESGLDISLAATEAQHPGPLAMIMSNTADSLGGGVLNFGMLTMHRVGVTGNQSVDGGGAIESSKAIVANTPTTLLYIEDSAVINNAATQGNGGGIDAYATQVTLKRMAFDSNTATYGVGDGGPDHAGGAIHVRGPAAVLDLENVSFYANHAANHGGGISTDGINVQLSSVTMYANSVSSVFTGARDIGLNTPTTARNTIFAGGCYPGTHVSLGGNVQANGNSCGLSTVTGDRPFVAEDSLGLIDNGFGGSFYVVGTFLSTNPAIDFHAGACPATDARGAPRPTGACDSGAFEFGATP